MPFSVGADLSAIDRYLPTSQACRRQSQVRAGLAAGGRWIRTSGSAPTATPLSDRGVKPQATAAGCHFGEILPQGATLMMATVSQLLEELAGGDETTLG